MSMIGKLRQVSEFELAKYKASPSEMVRALAGARHAGDPRAATRVAGADAQLLQQAREMQKAALSKAVPSAQPAAEYGLQEIDLHKSWHCLHFLLTGGADGPDGTPLGDAILGGVEIGGEAADTGYGPPRALSPGRVKSVAEALNAFPIDQKAQQFDSHAADKAGIYVAQHGAEELKEYFLQLRNFYEDAARRGNAVLLWIA